VCIFEKPTKRYFFKILRVALVCCFLLLVRDAYAASPSVFIAYRTDSIIAIAEGKSYYGEGLTRFSWAYLGIAEGNAVQLEPIMYKP
jgi:hypothetical protein